MPKLTDTQAILLATAARRTDGSVLPPPDSLGALSDRLRKAVATLIKRGFAIEQPVTAVEQAWRTDGDQQVGAIITDAGRRAIGVEPEVPGDSAEDERQAIELGEREQTALPAARMTKAALVLDLLRREHGATLDELVTATGWLPHTTRAALTGLRKKGHGIIRGKRGEVTCYTIARVAA